jgi:hypothetical protein
MAGVVRGEGVIAVCFSWCGGLECGASLTDEAAGTRCQGQAEGMLVRLLIPID